MLTVLLSSVSHSNKLSNTRRGHGNPSHTACQSQGQGTDLKLRESMGLSPFNLGTLVITPGRQ